MSRESMPLNYSIQKVVYPRLSGLTDNGIVANTGVLEGHYNYRGIVPKAGGGDWTSVTGLEIGSLYF